MKLKYGDAECFGIPVPNWADTFFSRANCMTGHVLRIPAVNITESPGAYLLEAVAPGMVKTDFSIYIDNGILIIEARMNPSGSVAEGPFTRKEFTRGSFKRSFLIPVDVYVDDISARYKNGLLVIKLPRRQLGHHELKEEIEW